MHISTMKLFNLNIFQIMAIKKVDNAAVSLQEEDSFLEAISNMSRLRHPNVVALSGYCVEHGQRLLVHDYIGNGSLHDMLHFADERSKMLTWNARVRVALGTARALEYVISNCLVSLPESNLGLFFFFFIYLLNFGPFRRKSQNLAGKVAQIIILVSSTTATTPN